MKNYFYCISVLALMACATCPKGESAGEKSATSSLSYPKIEPFHPVTLRTDEGFFDRNSWRHSPIFMKNGHLPLDKYLIREGSGDLEEWLVGLLFSFLKNVGSAINKALAKIFVKLFIMPVLEGIIAYKKPIILVGGTGLVVWLMRFYWNKKMSEDNRNKEDVQREDHLTGAVYPQPTIQRSGNFLTAPYDPAPPNHRSLTSK